MVDLYALSKGSVTLSMLTLRDITAQKEAEERLRTSEERFRMLCDNAPIGISISNSKTIMYTNSAFVNLFGYDGEEELLREAFLGASCA